MDDPKFHQHGGAHPPEHPQHRPYWKRMHHSLFFWIAFVFLMAAMIIYVMTDGFALRPTRKDSPPAPATSP